MQLEPAVALLVSGELHCQLNIATFLHIHFQPHSLDYFQTKMDLPAVASMSSPPARGEIS